MRSVEIYERKYNLKTDAKKRENENIYVSIQDKKQEQERKKEKKDRYLKNIDNFAFIYHLHLIVL